MYNIIVKGVRINYMQFIKTFDFKDVQLVPKKCVLKSRSMADTSIKLGKYTFKIPVIPANMASIMNEELAIWLAENNYFYIMHRFNPEKRLEFIKKMHNRQLYASISLGVQENDYKLIDQCTRQNIIPEFITIDIAHGDSQTTVDIIQYIKQKLPNSFVIAGNVCTPSGVINLENAGADAIKVGIGPGKACITRDKTGFGSRGWQLSSVNICSQIANKPIIADGGIRCNGDIAKAIHFGATAVMIGSLLAGHDENPGDILVDEEGNQTKQFFGSASEQQKNNRHHVEGKQLLVPYRGSIKDTLVEMEEDLQSAISYAGGKYLQDIKNVDVVYLNH